MSRVVVVGSANIDLIISAEVLPRPGETVLGNAFAAIPGGKGANQAIAAANAGASCAFIGAVGEDSYGDLLRENLVALGVDVSGLRRVAGPSGVALIAVDAHGENLIVVAPGANDALSRLDDEDLRLIASAEVTVCQLEVPLDVVGQALGAARFAVLNAAPGQPLPGELLANVDLLVVNESEASIVAGLDGTPEELLAALLDRVPRAVITLGRCGAIYGAASTPPRREPFPPGSEPHPRGGQPLTQGGQAHGEALSSSGEPHPQDGPSVVRVTAPQVEAVDTTCAGDAFTGALAVAWAEGKPVEEALRWACAAGAVCATKRGATMPAAEEIERLANIT